MTPKINEIYRHAAGGDSKAEKELFEVLTDRFHLFAHLRVWNREEAEDLVQEALAVVAAEYRAVNIETSFAAWAHKIMENRILGHIQKMRREQGRVIPGETNEYLSASWEPDPALRLRLLDCLKKVCLANPRYARIINLHHLGFSRQEICDKLELTLDQSYVVMSRARAKLKECLEKGNIDQ
ncbi:MAG: RNA polymerase sigma factor [Candidatus Zixiibacteriota bacterium]|nr:MAG: RNA polymerase sigma factor [candidate division Zixibacteria bacterium]